MLALSNLLAARSAFGLSLAFHIIFACFGMILPILVAILHYRWIKTGGESESKLLRFWTRILAIFFIVGAVSGTTLSFEIGLLWPTFMAHAGPIIGMPFSLEGAAFFLEAVALGVYLYGKNRLSPWMHWTAIVLVAITGISSGLFVIAANAWMNHPTGFNWVNGAATHIDPIAAMLTPAWPVMALHMLIASAMSVGFAVAAFHAYLLLRSPENPLHKLGIKTALIIAIPATLLQPLSGDLSAKWTAKHQPAKLAAFESHFHTTTGSDLIIAGIPNTNTQTVDYAIRIPKLLSFLAHGDFNSTVKGLDQFPRHLWPPVLLVHISFQIMVGIGFFLLGIGLISMVILRKAIWPKWWIKLLIGCGPLGFIALEAGWMVTELGRQPWVIYNVMTTAEAVTPMPGLQIPFILFSLIYLILSVMVVKMTWSNRRLLQ